MNKKIIHKRLLILPALLIVGVASHLILAPTPKKHGIVASKPDNDYIKVVGR